MIHTVREFGIGCNVQGYVAVALKLGAPHELQMRQHAQIHRRRGGIPTELHHNVADERRARQQRQRLATSLAQLGDPAVRLVELGGTEESRSTLVGSANSHVVLIRWNEVHGVVGLRLASCHLRQRRLVRLWRWLHGDNRRHTNGGRGCWRSSCTSIAARCGGRQNSIWRLGFVLNNHRALELRWRSGGLGGRWCGRGHQRRSGWAAL